MVRPMLVQTLADRHRDTLLIPSYGIRGRSGSSASASNVPEPMFAFHRIAYAGQMVHAPPRVALTD